MAAWTGWIIESARDVQPDINVEFLRTNDLVTIAAICAMSFLASLLWLAALWQYIWSKSR